MNTVNSIDALSVYWQSSEDMSIVEPESVQTVITSPPYWDLKDYGHEDQIGTTDESYEHYHDRMKTVWKECYDVLREDGTMWIVVDTVMERGDLQLLPYHIIQKAEEVGFVSQDLVTWYKPTAIAGMTDRNIVNKKEYIVYLSKNYDHKFCKSNIEDTKDDPAISGERPLGNLWRFPVKRGTIGQNSLHKAPYPQALVDRMVNISTEPDDTVLDPFLGSGTTALSALEHNRSCIGFEINQEFEDTISDRLDSVQQRDLTEF
ncbi:DNA-methyltransferase [Haloquadratum walsbyi]|jgi:site-specific DNA-methyltransferase (adenine-specific)|uniref:Type II methyltransferase n=1 Tax=Haloquadratum walsbyi (strain DSM 16854 / JCM 12705 / C23) TaxID=768065 RepID=G0LNC8_HALWC|nr:site-specific DNA-methyltransferase [Haloquadratum walsbyi]CCC41934.1 site-specific DNA-methyltransferase [Haloquadratum walsbyi C23]